MAHERAVEPGEPWTLGGLELIFTVADDTLTVTTTDEAGRTQRLAATDRWPALVKARAFGMDYGLSVRRGDAEGTLRVSSATGIRLGRGVGYLVDSDLDGTLGSKGDGVVVSGSKTVAPLPKGRVDVWTRRGANAFRRDKDGGWEMAVLPPPKPDHAAHTKAWNHWMWHRQAAGLWPLRYEPDLEGPMQKHIDYLQENNAYSHWQDPRKPGYSKEGARAGATSVIGNLKSSYFDAIDSQLTTLFHRSSVLAPELEASAMVWDRKMFMASTGAKNRGALRDAPLVYPGHGMGLVPCEFNIAAEAPAPFDGQLGDNQRGPAVAVRFAALRYALRLPEEPTFTLHEVRDGQRGNPVPCSLYYPGKTPKVRGASRYYLGHIALIPQQFLKPHTTYEASIDVLAPDKAGKGAKWERFTYTWRFHTASRRR